MIRGASIPGTMPLEDPEGTCSAQFDRGSRLHSVGGRPSIVYSDGREGWHWHGVQVRKEVVTDPAKIRLSWIREERNAEVRRVMIERFGMERYMVESGSALVDEERKVGKLWKTRAGFGDRSAWNGREEAIVMVQVTNSTPEPDGTFKDYWLRVPPGMTSARAAVAWTFGMSAKEYRPAQES